MGYPYYGFSARIGEAFTSVHLEVTNEFPQNVEGDLVTLIKNYMAAIPGAEYVQAHKYSISDTSV